MREDNIRNSDRVIVLEQMEGKQSLDSLGLVDKRLFTGENNIHAVMDKQTCLWNLKYDFGALPEVLRGQRYTSFDKALQHVETYFKKRNIRVKEVID